MRFGFSITETAASVVALMMSHHAGHDVEFSAVVVFAGDAGDEVLMMMLMIMMMVVTMVMMVMVMMMRR